MALNLISDDNLYRQPKLEEVAAAPDEPAEVEAAEEGEAAEEEVGMAVDETPDDEPQVIVDGDMLMVDAEPLMTPDEARALACEMIARADELDPAPTSLLARLERADDNAMRLVGEIEARDIELQTTREAHARALSERDAVLEQLAAVQRHLDSLRSTPVWEINFSGGRVFLAARDLPTAIVVFGDRKPGVQITSVRGAGVTLMV